MPYLIDAEDAPGSEALRRERRPDHLRYLEQQQQRLLAAGAKLSDDGRTATGSFYILDTNERPVAEDFIEADPFRQAGVFGRITLQRWRKGFFDFKRQPESGT